LPFQLNNITIGVFCVKAVRIIRGPLHNRFPVGYIAEADKDELMSVFKFVKASPGKQFQVTLACTEPVFPFSRLIPQFLQLFQGFRF
jgi:hypothetical protein